MKYYRERIVQRFKSLFSRQKFILEERIIEVETIDGHEKSSNWIAHHTSFTNRQIFLFWSIGALVAYASYLVFTSLSLVYLIVTWLLVAAAMEVFILRGERRVYRGWSITIMYIILIVFMLLGIVIIIPFLLNQIAVMLSMLINRLSTVGQSIIAMWLPNYIDSITRLPSIIKEEIMSGVSTNALQRQNSIVQNISSLISTWSGYVSNLWSMALSLIWSTISVLGKVVLVIILAVFFSIEKDRVKNFVVKHTSKDNYTDYMSEKVSLFYKKMGSWLKTQLVLSVFIFAVVLVALIILWWFGLKLPNILSLALMAGLTEFIPYIGPILGAIPAILVATMIFGRKWFLVVSIVYIAIQQLESNVLVPILMKKSLGVSPLLILLSALFFGSSLGFLGVLMAVPFAILITMIVKKDFT